MNSDPPPPRDRLRDRPRAWPRDLLALALLLAALLVFFAPLAFSNLIPAGGDAFLYFTPLWDYRDAALRDGRLPLWQPILFMGAPFLANSQAGVLYPPNWLDLLGPPGQTPEALKWALIGHLALGGLLTYAAGRRLLGLVRPAAWLAGALYALGGYLAGQFEHANQVQALAWLPALFPLLAAALVPAPAASVGAPRWGGLRPAPLLGLAAVLALQLLAGHSQSVFVSLGGLGVYALWLALAGSGPGGAAVEQGGWRRWPGRARRALARVRPGDLRPLAALGLAGAFALALAAAQLLPTAELSRESLRSGGLSEPEALSFSLAPPIAGRALLPAYEQAVFNEYVAFVGAGALVLALFGAWSTRREPRAAGLAVVALLGLFFALGGFNPLYRLLVRFMPGFDLFRVPARWLALWACSGALLAGAGLDALWRGRVRPRGALLLALAGVALTAVLVVLSATATTGPRGEVILGWQRASRWVEAAWLGAAALAGALVVAAATWPRARPAAAAALIVLALAELYGGTRRLPYNQPTAPVAWHGVRPALAHLLAAQAADPDGPLAAARFLSLSTAEFDPGDAGEIWSAYGPSWPSACGQDAPGRPDLVSTVNPQPLLSAEAVCQLLIAAKHKEVLSPNLPLGWDVPAADGYDGGVLPLRHYATFARLLLPEGGETRDGRLRENLVAVPEGRYLALMNVRWLITDKVGDVPYEGVFYDLRHGAVLAADDASSLTLALPADFEATELRLVGRLVAKPAPSASTPVLSVQVTFSDGGSQWLEAPAGALGREDDGVARLSWGAPHRVSRLVLAARLAAGTIAVRGATLVDARTGAFQMLVVSGSGRYRLAHSADVKIYENLDALPRAFLVPEAITATDEEALAGMRAPDWQPAARVFLAPDGSGAALPPAAGDAAALEGAELRLRTYRPERVIVDLELPAPAWLVLTDAWYPGWEATLDGEPAALHRADVLFRAVYVPAGSHRVRLVFEPASWRAGAAISVMGWVAFAIAALASLGRMRGRW